MQKRGAPMFYLSTCVAQSTRGDDITVGCGGEIHSLAGETAQLWRGACRKVSRNAPPGLDTLFQKGLVETSTETIPLFAASQILNRCILYVMDTPIQITLAPSCRRLLRWLARSICCLSAADVIRSQDRALPETPYLNGHSQERLVAALYQGITEPLETAMLQSPVFTGTMMDLLTLVHNQYIRLL